MGRGQRTRPQSLLPSLIYSVLVNSRRQKLAKQLLDPRVLEDVVVLMFAR
jgi:hypothetical protein